MKSFMLVMLVVCSLFLFMSCNSKDCDLPTGTDIQFSLDPQLNKTYTFHRWDLDSLDQKTGSPFLYYDKNVAKNISIGGKNDAFISINYSSPSDADSTYLRIENGKDIYEWVDTTQFYLESSKSSMRNILAKITQNEAWIARALLSKGNGAEYVMLPKRFYPVQVSPDLVLNVSFETIGKNEGFENVTVPAGTFNSYKVKVMIKTEAYLGTQIVDRINFIQYIWLSDELDFWVKQYLPTVKSSTKGVIEPGVIKELVSVQ